MQKMQNTQAAEYNCSALVEEETFELLLDLARNIVKAQRKLESVDPRSKNFRLYEIALGKLKEAFYGVWESAFIKLNETYLQSLPAFADFEFDWFKCHDCDIDFWDYIHGNFDCAQYADLKFPCGIEADNLIAAETLCLSEFCYIVSFFEKE